MTQDHEHRQDPARAELVSQLPPERPLPAGTRTAMKERLTTSAERDVRRNGTPQWIKLTAAAAVGGLVVLTAGWAVDRIDDRPTESVTTAGESVRGPAPDPDHVEQLMENLPFTPEGNQAEHLDAAEPFLPVLRGSRVMCVFDGTPTSGMDLWDRGLNSPVTEDDIRRACDGAVWREQAFISDEDTPLCIVDRSSSPMNDLAVPGAPTAPYLDEYPVPAVAFGSTDCADIGRPWDDDLLHDINWRRAVDVAVFATPDCRDLQATREWVQRILRDEGLSGEFEIEVFEDDDVREPCYTARMDWQHRLIRIIVGEAAEGGPPPPVRVD